MKTRKTAVDLTDLALGIIVLGIVASIGASILISTRDARLTDLDAVTTTNETVTTVTETASNLANTWVKNISQCVLNNNGTVIASPNYTTTIDTTDFGIGTVAFTGADTQFNNTGWNCTYSWYNTSRADWDLANDAAIGIGEYGNWFKIIVIVGVAAVVLSLIFLAFGRRGQAEAVSY